MSRLESHQKKQFVRKIIFYSICLVLLVVLLVFVGLKLLINATLFISNLGKKPTQSTQNSQNFFGNVNISNVPESTNSAQIFVSGSTSNFDTIEFYINGEKVKQIDVKSSDSFSEEIGDLKKGTNEVYVTGKSNNAKQTKDSEKFTVSYVADKPKLEVTDPQDNSTVNKPDITISGNTNPGISLKVNAAPAVVDTQGHFQYQIQLKEGDNKVEIAAQDDAGNTEQKTITVKYQKD